MIPEMPYQSTRYDSAYSGAASMHTSTRLPGGHSHPSSHPLQMRSMTQQHQSQHPHQPQPLQHWTQPQMLPPLNPMEPFVSACPYLFSRRSMLFSFTPHRRGTWWGIRLMITTLDTNDNNDSICFSLKIRLYCDRSLSIVMAIPSENPVAANFACSGSAARNRYVG